MSKFLIACGVSGLVIGVLGGIFDLSFITLVIFSVGTVLFLNHYMFEST